MADLSQDQLIAIAKDSHNYLFSKSEKQFKEGKNKSNTLNEMTVMSKIGGSSLTDLSSLSQIENPEEYLMQCLENDNGMAGKGKRYSKKSLTINRCILFFG